MKILQLGNYFHLLRILNYLCQNHNYDEKKYLNHFLVVVRQLLSHLQDMELIILFPQNFYTRQLLSFD